MIQSSTVFLSEDPERLTSTCAQHPMHGKKSHADAGVKAAH